MPIYAYRCDECGFSKDVLQKISDPVLTVCPSCGKPSFKKQVTAAGFQLKGSGWYVTDFRGGTPPATGTAAGTGGATRAQRPRRPPQPHRPRQRRPHRLRAATTVAIAAAAAAVVATRAAPEPGAPLRRANKNNGISDA